MVVLYSKAQQRQRRPSPCGSNWQTRTANSVIELIQSCSIQPPLGNQCRNQAELSVLKEKSKRGQELNRRRRRRGQPTQQYLWLLDHCRHCCCQKKTTTIAKQSLFLDPSISDAVGQAAYSKIYSRWQVLSIRSTKRRKPTVAIAASTECASLPTHNQTKKEKKRRTKYIRAKRTGSSAILFTMTHSRSWRKRRRSIRFTFSFLPVSN